MGIEELYEQKTGGARRISEYEWNRNFFYFYIITYSAGAGHQRVERAGPWSGTSSCDAQIKHACTNYTRVEFDPRRRERVYSYYYRVFINVQPERYVTD